MSGARGPVQFADVIGFVIGVKQLELKTLIVLYNYLYLHDPYVRNLLRDSFKSGPFDLHFELNQQYNFVAVFEMLRTLGVHRFNTVSLGSGKRWKEAVSHQGFVNAFMNFVRSTNSSVARMDINLVPLQEHEVLELKDAPEFAGTEKKLSTSWWNLLDKPEYSFVDSLYLRLRDPNSMFPALNYDLQNNTFITTLVINNVQLDDTNAIMLGCYSFARNRTLTTVVLRNNLIGVGGSNCMFNALRVNTTMTYLDLANNLLTAQSCDRIKESLRVNNTLTYLNLSGNMLGDNGMALVLEGLAENGTLQELDISQTGLTHANSLANYFGCPAPRLRSLSVYGNYLDLHGLHHISSVIAINPNAALTSLALGYNGFAISDLVPLWNQYAPHVSLIEYVM